MSKLHSDPTANTAIGAIDRELSRMRKKADKIALQYALGTLTAEDIRAARREFKGIYRPLLDAALGVRP